MLASLVSCAEADVIDISPARPSSFPLSFTIDKMLQPYFSPAQLQPYSRNKMSKRKNTPEVISSSNHCLSTGRIGNLCCFQRILTIILLSHWRSSAKIELGGKLMQKKRWSKSEPLWIGKLQCALSDLWSNMCLVSDHRHCCSVSVEPVQKSNTAVLVNRVKT